MRTPDAALFSFRELFNPERGIETTFRIPDYQRAYSWDKPQRSDLRGDIEKLRDRRSNWSGDSATICPSHFCGTVICTPADDHTLYIVDGQQRLTSLVILHRCLSKALRENRPHPLSPKLFPQAIDKNLFIDLVASTQHAKPVTEGQKWYVNARNEFDKWVAELDGPEVERTLSAIEDGLSFILFTLENDHEVSKVFESINNRGKPLTQMDLVKNHLLFLEGEFEREPRANEAWKKILGEVANTNFRGGEDPDTVLRAVVSAMFLPGRRQAGETDFKIIAKKIKSHNELVLFIRFLEFSFGVFRELRDSCSTTSGEVRKQLTYLNFQPSISGMLPLIFVRQFRRSDNDNEDAPILKTIEKVNFRLYGFRKAAARSDSHDIKLQRIAYKYFQDMVGTSDVRSELEDLIRLPPAAALTQIVKALSLDDDDLDNLYQWPACRYFLARWEADQLKSQDFNWTAYGRPYRTGKSSDYYSVEHFFPQKSGTDDYRRVFEYKGELITRRLGNLILIPHGVNIGLSNLGPEKKLEKLRVEDARVQGLNVRRLEAFYAAAECVTEKLVNRELSGFDVSPRSRFNSPTIEQNRSIAFAKTFCDIREEQMIRFALRTWRLDSEMGKDEEFLGVLSFRTDGEAFRADKDDGKHNTNYVIRAGNEAPDEKLQTMIFQRNGLEECKKLLE